MNKKQKENFKDMLDTGLELSREVDKLEKDWVKQYDKTQAVRKEFAIFKIMTHLINNGVEPDLAKVLATDTYKMAIGDL